MLAGLFYFRVEIVHRVVPEVAAYYGIQVNEFSVEAFDADRIALNDLAFSYEDDYSAVKAELQGVQADIKISLADGLQISRISANSANVVHHVYQTETASSAPSVADQLTYLPVFGVDIKQLGIEQRLGDNDQLLAKFLGQVAYQNGLQINGVAHYHGLDANIDLLVDKENVDVAILEVEEDAEVLKINGSYYLDDGWLVLKAVGAYSLENVSRYYQAGNNDTDQFEVSVNTVSGDFNAAAELDLTQTTELIWSSFVAQVELDASIKFTSQKHAIKDARADLRVECIVKSLKLDGCTANQPQSVFVQFESTPAWINEYLGKKLTTYNLEVNPKNVVELKRIANEHDEYKIHGDVNLLARTESPDFKAELTLVDNDIKWSEQSWSLFSAYTLNTDIRYVNNMVNIQRALLNVDGNIVANKQKAELQFNKASSLALFDVVYDELRVDRLELTQQGNATALYEFATNKFRMSDQRISLAPKMVKYSDSLVSVDQARFDLSHYMYSESGTQMDSALSVASVKVKRKGLTIQAEDILANVQLKGNHLDANGRLLLGSKRAPLKFELANDVSVHTGDMHFESEPISLTNNEVVAQIIGMTGFPLQLKDGNFTLDGDISWQNGYVEPNILANLSALQIDGDYAQNQFDNLNMTMRLQGKEGWVLVEPTTLTVDRANVGVPLTDIRMQIEAYEYGVQPQPTVKITDFYASALEGSVFSNLIDIDLNKPVNNFTLYLSSLSLEKLVELNQTQDLHVTGIIDGELPMKLNEGVLEIDSGWMRADEKGGFIQYGRVKEVLTGNKDLKLVAELLEDFQYNEMSVLVNLSPDGALRLETKLHGQSPDAEFNAPVNLNFNIDLNLWKFLESARLLTRIGQDITEQVSKPNR